MKHKYLRKDRLNIMNYILDNTSNGGKWIDYSMSKGNYFQKETDREVNTKFFLTILRGNNIKVYEHQHIYNDLKDEDGFFRFTKTQRKLLIKIPINQYELFVKLYKELTPSLLWNDDEN